MNTRRTHRCLIRCFAIAFALSAVSLGAQAQQGFDQPPTYPNQMGSPPAGGAYPPSGQMPNQNLAHPGYPAGGAPQPGQPQPGMAMPGAPGTGHYPSPNQGSTANHPGGNPLQYLLQMEMQDYGVPPSQQLQTQMHGPTPTSIPGGQVITTDRLLALYQQGQSNGLQVFHVLNPGPSLPMAQNAVGAAQPGNFQDQTQQEFGQYLQQVTQGNKALPLVFYCQSTQCWMSYNAALRAIHMGFTQVYWYRGGVEAWQSVQQAASAGMPAHSGQQNHGYQMATDQRMPFHN